MPEMLNQAAMGAQQLPQGPPPGPAGPPAPGASPDTAMPEAGGAKPPNPVADSIRTLMTFVAAQQEKGNPKATGMMQALQGFVESVQGVGGQQAPMSQGPPPTQNEPPPPGDGRISPEAGREKSSVVL